MNREQIYKAALEEMVGPVFCENEHCDILAHRMANRARAARVGPCSTCCQLPDEVACWNCEANAKAAKVAKKEKRR